MDRHANDKHSKFPVVFKCLFPPCGYESKRESNCKQHMEKAHDYDYFRSRNNSGSGAIKQSQSPKSGTLSPDSTFPVPETSFLPALSPESMDFPTPSTDTTMPITDNFFPPSSEQIGLTTSQDFTLPFRESSFLPEPIDFSKPVQNALSDEFIQNKSAFPIPETSFLPVLSLESMEFPTPFSEPTLPKPVENDLTNEFMQGDGFMQNITGDFQLYAEWQDFQTIDWDQLLSEYGTGKDESASLLR